MELFVLRRRSGAQRTLRRRVAAPRRILLCHSFFGAVLVLPSGSTPRLNAAPLQKSDAVEWQESSPVRVCCLGTERGRSAVTLLRNVRCAPLRRRNTNNA